MRSGLLSLVMTALFCSLFVSACARDTFLTTSDGVRIAYEYKPVQNAKGSVILIHGLGSNMDEWYTLVKYLRQNSWSTVTLDLRGHGLSTAWQGGDMDWNRFKAEGYLSMVKDIEAALAMLKGSDPFGNCGGLSPCRIWLIGSSMGSDLAVIFAKTHPEIQGIVLLSPPANFAGQLMEEEIKHMGQRPVLIAASRDDGFFADVSEKIKNQYEGEVKLLLYEKAGHGSAMIDNEKKLKKEILEWINQRNS